MLLSDSLLKGRAGRLGISFLTYLDLRLLGASTDKENSFKQFF